MAAVREVREIGNMITLAQFPDGCGGCGGACCKRPMRGPWNTDEVARLDELLGHDLASVERFRMAGDWVPQCWHLTDDGLCGLQLAGLPKPVACAAYEVGCFDCIVDRKREGVHVG